MFTTNHTTYTDPADSRSRGRQFAEEAKRHYEKEKDQPCIPLMQGQFSMFVYEETIGSGSKSMEFLMSTFDTHRALNNVAFLNPPLDGKSEERLQREREGLSWAMWGLYCSEW